LVIDAGCESRGCSRREADWHNFCQGSFLPVFYFPSQAWTLRPQPQETQVMTRASGQGDPRRSRIVARSVLLILSFLCAVSLTATGCTKKDDKGGTGKTSGTSGGGKGDTIKVGILHSLTGTMAISETSLKDAEVMAIEE